MPVRPHARIIPQALVSLLNRFDIFYGWWIVFSAAAIVFLSAGTFFYGFSLLVGPLTDEFGWSRASISIGFSLRTELGGVAAPIVGFALDRVGVRRITLAGVFIVTIGMVMISQTQSLWFFYLSVVVLAIGMSGTGGATASAVISHWFRRQRGKALGLMTLGGGAGGLSAVVFAWLINDFGWRDALLIVAVSQFIICVPLALSIHNRPSDIGLEPDGLPQDVLPAGAPPPPEGPEITTGQALRSPLFWRMALVFGLSNFATTALIVHQVPFLEEQVGFSHTLAAVSVTAMIAVSIVGRLGFGGAADRYSPTLVMALGLGFTATGLLMFAAIREPWQSVFPLVFFGIGFGAAIPLRSVLQAEYFGLRAFGAIQGMILTVTTFFAFVGPIMAGYMYDASESYRLAFVVLACGPALGIPLILTLQSPRSRRAVEDPATV
jgi:sugar phosphate permease